MDKDYFNSAIPIVPKEEAFSGLLKKIFEKIGPKIDVDEEEKIVYLMKKGIFFTNITEAYYILKGYSVRNF
jgi:hypothetical protein